MSGIALRTPDVQTLHAKLHAIFGYKPRDEQVEAIKTLAIDQQDLILTAHTGFGKSMVFHSISVLRGGISLIIMPLNLLEEEQVC